MYLVFLIIQSFSWFFVLGKSLCCYLENTWAFTFLLATSKRETLLNQQTFALNFYHRAQTNFHNFFFFGYLSGDSDFWYSTVFFCTLCLLCALNLIFAHRAVEFHNALTYIKIQKREYRERRKHIIYSAVLILLRIESNVQNFSLNFRG